MKYVFACSLSRLFFVFFSLKRLTVLPDGNERKRFVLEVMLYGQQMDMGFNIQAIGLSLVKLVTQGLFMDTKLFFQNGKLTLDINPSEMRMSHWVYAPVLINTETAEVLFDLSGKGWDFRSAEENGDDIILKLARYPDANNVFRLVLNISKDRASLNGNIFSINDVCKVLEDIA